MSSRFISQGDIDLSKARRDQQWKEAYARLGQDPPSAPAEDSDTRSLAEKLSANKIAKQEEWEERSKLANQFRALEEDEVAFLDAIQEKRDAEERHRQLLDGEELVNFRQAVAVHQSTASTSEAPKPKLPAPPPPPKKPLKKSLKGLVAKKKAKPSPKTSSESPSLKRKPSPEPLPDSDTKRRKEH